MEVISHYSKRRTLTIRGEAVNQYKWTCKDLSEMPISRLRQFFRFWENRDWSVLFREKPSYESYQQVNQYKLIEVLEKKRIPAGVEYVYRFK